MRIPPTLRRLPTARALVGSALVLAAAVGVLLAHDAATRPPRTRFVVARSAVPAGHVLRASDLGTIALALPSGSAALPARSASGLVGRRTAVALRRLDILRPDDLAARTATPRPAGVVVPVEIERGRLPARSVRPGAVFDVLATDPDASGTVPAATRAEVVGIDQDVDSPADGAVRVRLRVPDSTTAATLVDASVRATLTLVLPADDERGRP